MSYSFTKNDSNYNNELEFELEFEQLVEKLISVNTPKKNSSSKLWLLDIDSNDVILSKSEVYFTLNDNGNRNYYKTIDDTPLFQNKEAIDEYKEKLKTQIS